MSRKNDKDDDLDTETTFANMNVEGFRWYDPTRKNGKRQKVQKVSRKEYWQMVRGAFAAFMPYFMIFLLSIAIVGVLLYLWLS